MNNDELYHYHGGSQYISGQDELYHYGVPGMKWGQRKAQRYDAKIAKLQARQKNLRATRDGVKSDKFLSTAKKLNILKAKKKLLEAKNANDAASKIVAKENLKAAKKVTDVREIKALKLTDVELNALKRQDIAKKVDKILGFFNDELENRGYDRINTPKLF